MKAGDIKTWKLLTIGVQQLVRLQFNNNLINPGLALKLFILAQSQIRWPLKAHSDIRGLVLSFPRIASCISPVETDVCSRCWFQSKV